MNDIQEIKAAISSFQTDTTWLKLRARWDSDFDFYRLDTYDAGSGYYSYTTNSPRVYANKAIGMLSKSKIIIRYPDDTLNSEELTTANNIERFLYGVINMNNDFYTMIDAPSVQAQLSWYTCIRGACVIRPYVKKLEDGSTFPELALWDIYNVAYAMGSRGLKWAAHTRTATKSEIKDEYDIDIGKSSATVIDFWDEKNNGVIVDNMWGKPLQKHGLDYCPVYIIRSGAMPQTVQQKYSFTGIHRGESIYAATRTLYPLLSKTASDYLTVVRRGVKPPLGFWSAGGTKNLEEDIWQVEHGMAVPMDSLTNDKIEPLIQPTMPTDAKDMLNFILSEVQLGSISHVGLGQLGFRLSGFAINQLQAALETVIVPFVECLERTYTIACMSIQNQYAKGNWKPVEVRGRTSKNTPFGIPQAIKIAPKDIAADWRPEIKLLPTYPKDDAQRYQLAKLATDGERPLLAMKTALEDIIGVEDTLLEEEKKANEWADSLMLVRLAKAYEAALADLDFGKAQNILMELQRLLLGQYGTSSGQSGGAGFSPLSQISMGSAGMGLPSEETGLSPQVLPPETQGGVPGGAVNAGEV